MGIFEIHEEDEGRGAGVELSITHQFLFNNEHTEPADGLRPPLNKMSAPVSAARYSTSEELWPTAKKARDSAKMRRA